MRTIPTFLQMGFAATCLVAALASVAATSSSTETKVLQKTYVFKAEEFVFTGTVITNDLNAKTISINGHRPLGRETVEKFVTRGTVSKEGKKPPVKDAVQVFQADSFCRVALTNRPTARLADVQGGDLVDVEFRKIDAGTNDIMVASLIRTAEKHPYDPAPAKTQSKKK